MNLREFLAKRKIHLFFVGAFLSVLALNFTIGLTSGQTFLSATWTAFSEIRPADYVMFALFWYACVTHRPKDDWHSPFTTLNLFQSNNRK